MTPFPYFRFPESIEPPHEVTILGKLSCLVSSTITSLSLQSVHPELSAVHAIYLRGLHVLANSSMKDYFEEVSGLIWDFFSMIDFTFGETIWDL